MAQEILKGTPLSPGIAIGALQLAADAPHHEQRVIDASQVDDEIAAVRRASATVCAELLRDMDRIPQAMREYRDIIAAQMELAKDGTLLNGACGRIKSRKICASWAIYDTVEELAGMFAGFADPYLRDRAQDIRTVGRSLQEALGAGRSDPCGKPDIFAAHDVSPMDVIELHLQGAKGCLTVNGGPTSHASILARGLRIPAVSGMGALFLTARDGDVCIVDGLSGTVLLNPSAEETARYARRKEHYRAFEKQSRGCSLEPAVTADGRIVEVLANLENTAEIQAFLKSGAAGVGLYRTECAFLGRELPSEELLYAEYRAIINAAAPGPVVFRALDLGADKVPASGLMQPEKNPALGLRGIRFCLNRPDIFKRQLRPLLRAMANTEAILLLPMVSNPLEIAQTRRIMDETRAGLAAAGLPHAEKVSLGVMIETPAAMMICDSLAQGCEYLSLGTNDLLHYMLAIDRNNRNVAYLHDPLHPAFVRALKQAVDTAHAAGARVSVCGELAGDPFGVVMLLGIDVDILSTSPRFVPQIKQLVRKLSASDCRLLAAQAMRRYDPVKIRSLVRDALQDALGDNLSFYTTLISCDSNQ